MSGDTDDDSFLSILYHALQAQRRRETIRFVSTNTQTVAVRTLGKNIAAVEQGLSPMQATGEPYRNVYNALSQTHLPALSDAGIIIYDPNRQTVAPGPNLALAALIVTITEPTIDAFRNN